AVVGYPVQFRAAGWFVAGVLLAASLVFHTVDDVHDHLRADGVVDVDKACDAAGIDLSGHGIQPDRSGVCPLGPPLGGSWTPVGMSSPPGPMPSPARRASAALALMSAARASANV